MNRRTFVKGIAGLGALGAIAGLYSWQIEPFWLEFVTIEMPITHLPAHLEGKTLMQISDMHVGNKFRRSYLIDALKKAQRYEPDWVVYTGDYVTYESPEQFDQLKEVMQHAVRGKWGTVGILGNHDYGKGWRESEVADTIVELLKEAKITVLRNEQTEVQGLHIIGLDDFWGTNFHPEAIMKQIAAEKAAIVLCHNPDVMDMPVWEGYKGWVLAGHTHGGQCKPPFLAPPMLPVKNKRYTAGKFDFEDGRTLYINRALGHLWQIRFNVRPEITIFKLKSKNA